MAWVNEEVARQFAELAELYTLLGDDGFRVRAYQRAARALSGHGADLAGLSERELAAIPGVGKAVAAKVREFLSSGRIAKLDAQGAPRQRAAGGVVAAGARRGGA
jgi:DNA polymerase (family 10)